MQEKINQHLKEILITHHEKVIQPEIIRLNGLPKVFQTPAPFDKTSYRDLLQTRQFGDVDPVLNDLSLFYKKITDSKKRKLAAPPDSPLSDPDICTALRHFANEFNQKKTPQNQITQLQPVDTALYHSSQINSLIWPQHAIKPDDLTGSRKKNWEIEKEQIYLMLNGTDREIWQWTEWHNEPFVLESLGTKTYSCWPNPNTNPSIYLKFSSKGLYFLESDNTLYPNYYPDSETHVTISVKLGYGQFKMHGSGWSWWWQEEVWPVLDRGGVKIVESNWVNGTQMRYVGAPHIHWHDEPLLVNMQFKLLVSVRDWAFAILDFRGWEDSPYWYFFDVWVVGATPGQAGLV